MVDDTRLELAEACRFAPGIRRLFRLSKLKLEFGHKLRVLIPEEKRKPTAQISCRFQPVEKGHRKVAFFS